MPLLVGVVADGEHLANVLEVDACTHGPAPLRSMARFDCTIYREVEAGDHLIVLLQLHAVEHSVGQPLVFHRSGFGRLAG